MWTHLIQTFEDEHLSQLSKECSLTDMLAFDDADHDGHLNLNEFYAAFSKLYSKIYIQHTLSSFFFFLF